MTAPIGLTIKTRVEDMAIGDCIPCRYKATSGVAGTFSELGTCVATEIPIAGAAAPDGLFYLIKADTGLLIADRVVQHSISWNTLNAAKYIQGTYINTTYVPVGSEPFFIRSLTGGVSHLSATGESSISNQNLGAWPPNNEWDAYIYKSTLEDKIAADNDSVWHWSSARSWAQDTPINGLSVPSTTSATSVYRIARSYPLASSKYVNAMSSDTINNSIGFRPVLEYIENAKQTNLWY